MKKLCALASLAVLGAIGFIVAGCGSEHAVSLGPPAQTGSTTGSDIIGTGSSTATSSGPIPTRVSFEVWFARGERLFAAPRTHPATPRVATAALDALLAGPTRVERASGLATAIPARTRLLGVSIKGGVATVNLTSEYQSGGSLSMQVRLGQVVYTLTQFPTVKAVRFELDGAPVNVFSSKGIVVDHPVRRSDYKDLSPSTVPVDGSWGLLPKAPIAPDAGLTSVWTGRQMLVFGRRQLTALDARGNPYSRGAVNVAAAYDSIAGSWRRLPSPGPTSSFMSYSAVWTGKEMLVWGEGTREAFNPLTNQWRRLPPPPSKIHDGAGIVVWTGSEMIGWGGGCCGDAFSDGAAYSPATNTWRELAPAPVGGQQSPTGAWTGRELIILDGRDADGKAVGGAAYNPSTDTWRRIASLPAPRSGANVVWDGREVLVVGGGAGAQSALPAVGFAFKPASNSWRQLPPMEFGRTAAAAVWTGKRLLLWGGQTGRAGSLEIPPHGFAYDPEANRWSPLPKAPLLGRADPTAVWTGHSMVVWGGETNEAPSPGKSAGSLRLFTDGAAFTPTKQ